MDEQLTVSSLRASYAPEGRGARRRTSPAVVQDVDLEIQRGHFYALLGPSGCGKTTLLRCVAGLHRPDRGSIAIAGRTVFCGEGGIDVAPNRRRIGMVFQSYAVWPHLDAFANVAFPLEALPRSERPGTDALRDQVMEALEMVELAEFAHRPAARLSGGQQQRLALARALVGAPELLLLDEPLSNLDARLRSSMRIEVKRLQRELGVTVLYVTHDQDEALSMSSCVAVMSEGRLVQVGAPEDVYGRPANRFVASFVGQANLLRCEPGEDRLSDGCVSTEIGPLWTNDRMSVDGTVVMIRPEDVEVGTVEAFADRACNTFDGRVDDVGFRGDALDVVVRVAAARIQARLLPGSEVSFSPGDAVRLHLAPEVIRRLAD